MLTLISAIYFAYIVLKLYISVMQIGFISKEKHNQAFLLTQEEYLKAGNYSISKEKLVIISLLIDYALFVFWFRDGFQLLENYLSLYLTNESLITVSFLMSFFLINSIFGLPLDIYSKFKLDEKYGFNRSTWKLYVSDKIKALFLTVVFGSPIILAISFFIETFEFWWLWAFIFIFGLAILINMIYPTLIAPIFNKMTPLDDEELNSKIKNLLSKVGFKSSGVFVVDASKRDSRLNAYFGGFGKTKRVVLFDTLLEKLNTPELLAVLGHELGHFKHGDIYKNIIMMGILLFSVFAILGNLPEELFFLLGVENKSYILIAVILLLMPLFEIFFVPIMGLVSRHNEYKADEVGSELSGNSLFLSEALKKLVIENKHFPKSHKIYIFFNYTHPPISERLEALEKINS
jgi:STE24 endopeptidase